MSINSSVIDSIESAVDKEPDNDDLRLHLATLLLDSGDAARALDHCAFVLSRKPDHLGALECAANSADKIGDQQRAEGYRRLYRALSNAEIPSSKSNADDAVEEISDPRQPVRMRLINGGANDDEFVGVENPPITL